MYPFMLMHGRVFHHSIDKCSKFKYVNRKFGAFNTFIGFKVGLDKIVGERIMHFDWIIMMFY